MLQVRSLGGLQEHRSASPQDAGYGEDTSVVEFRVGPDEEKIGRRSATSSHLEAKGLKSRTKGYVQSIMG